MNSDQILATEEEIYPYFRFKPIYEKLLDHYPEMTLDVTSKTNVINCMICPDDYILVVSITDFYNTECVYLSMFSLRSKKLKTYPVRAIQTQSWSTRSNPLQRKYRDVDLFIKHLDGMINCIYESEEVIATWDHDCRIDQTLAKINQN